MTIIKRKKKKEKYVLSSSREKRGAVFVPVAIVIAGALIAVAIYFGGDQIEGSGVGQQGSDEQKPLVAEEPAVKQPIVGEVRSVGEQDHIRGAKNAKITVIEYSDLECPFCKMFHPTMQKLVDEYPNDVRWVYRHFPLEQLHSKAIKEAEATECAAEQGKFWEFTDKIFKVTPSNDGLDLAQLPQLAKEVEVSNIAQFETCLESGKYKQHVQDDLADAAAAGGRGTPYSVILTEDGQKFPISGAQPYESVKEAVDRLLSL